VELQGAESNKAGIMMTGKTVEGKMVKHAYIISVLFASKCFTSGGLTAYNAGNRSFQGI
jgi:hypothetical protein